MKVDLEMLKEMSLIERAILIATIYHAGQKDKGGKEYILHPISVMEKVNDEKEKIVAILHDVVEDTEITLDDLKTFGFSEEIIKAVESVTKKENEDYMTFVKRAKQNPIGRMVKIADLKNNSDLTRIKKPNEKDIKRIEKYKKAMEELIKDS